MPAITHKTIDYHSSTLHFVQPLSLSLRFPLSLTPRKRRLVWRLERLSYKNHRFYLLTLLKLCVKASAKCPKIQNISLCKYTFSDTLYI